MKHSALYFGLAAALVASCSTKEIDIQTPLQDDVFFYASFEQPADEGTRVYANEDLHLRWTADDRVSIFNKITYNQQYKFTGETGDNAGGFRKVDTDEFMTGNAISHVVSVYPYQERTKISESESLTLTLPAEQHYAENTFGLGANTMVSVTTDNVLQYKNVGGYLRLSLYGEGVSVSSITLKGNNGEKLAGKATVTMPLDGVPSVTMAEDASDQITLVCDTPVALGATVEESKDFWFVVPPVTFGQGFTVFVSETTGGIFNKTTNKSISLERSVISKMTPMKVEKTLPEGNIVFADENVKTKLVAAFDTDGDGELSYTEAAAVTSGNDLKSAFGTIKTYKSFDEFQYFTGVSDIPYSMFEGWNLLSTITLPESIVSIGAYGFKDCISIESLVLPKHVHSIGIGAFSGCTALKRMIIPDGVTGNFGNPSMNNTVEVKYGIFSGCSALEEVVLPEGITTLGAYCFDRCSNLSKLNIPSSVRTFCFSTFYGCKKLTEIPIPSTMTVIPPCAFQECESLTSVVLPETLQSIGQCAFANCKSITQIIIPESVTLIEKSAFEGCSSLTEIDIPESISSINNGTFSQCLNLSRVTIPESVTTIGTNAFMGCQSLESVFLPESIIKIGADAFGFCTNLKSINLPSKIATIELQLFEYCSNLTSIVIPSGIESIGGGAFQYSGLTSIHIPTSVKYIGSYAFKNCTKLLSVSLPESVSDIYAAFIGCVGLTSITVPSSVTEWSSAFRDCSGLVSVVINEGIQSIDSYTFYNCSNLKTISIPQSVTRIGDSAFNGCTGLTSITVKPTLVPEGGTKMFDKTSGCPIYVPSESVESYKVADYWSNYASRIQAIPSSSVPVPEAVDLGLPSGLKWASFNLGASKPEEYGDYYAWGETEPYYSSLNPLVWKEGKEVGYSWATYKWCMGTSHTMTKYCNDSSHGYNGFTDTKTVLDPEDDVANVNLGSGWRMPTDAEWTELRENCTWTWTTKNGVDGYRVTGPSGTSIFLPAAGSWDNTNYYYRGTYGFYWSSSLFTAAISMIAWRMQLGSSGISMDGCDRYYGFSVRPVYAE